MYFTRLKDTIGILRNCCVYNEHRPSLSLWHKGENLNWKEGRNLGIFRLRSEQRSKDTLDQGRKESMASRIAARFVSRRFSSGGKILSEEERAAENVYIKKIEQEKLEKLARKGPKPEEAAATTSSAASVSDAKPSVTASSDLNTSTDKNRNYGVLAGVIAGLGALGWYLKASSKKPVEVQD